ncbi:hypothetical protein WH5701_08494 [Synechococcus sp. WH 5701]|nr:hypothetical protein WH5701_08494 [Synechococcus sp. WH 5701]
MVLAEAGAAALKGGMSGESIIPQAALSWLTAAPAGRP